MTRRRALRWVASIAIVVLLGVVLVRSGSRLRDHLEELSVPSVLGAGLCVLGGLTANLLVWRAVLADLGSPLPIPAAVRVFFLSQLGKYLPGSVWPFLAQMELGKEHGVPRSRSGAVGIVTLALSLTSGLAVAALSLPFSSPGALDRYWWAFIVLPLLGIVLIPSVANRALATLFRLTRRGTLERGLTERGLLIALGWAALSWVLFGAQVAVLADALGAHGGALLPVGTGAFALAWTVGFLVVIAPAGAGVREAVLVIALAPVLARDEALLLALVSRALMSVGDVAGAGIAVLLRRAHQPIDGSTRSRGV